MNIEHPYSDLADGQWLRGNLHAHTTRSDGQRPPQEVLNDYAAHGHNFLMISDHDIFTSPDDYRGWDSRGMVMIPGNEVTANGVHMLHVNGNRRVEPDADRQKVLNAIKDAGGFAIVNHPNWFANWDHCAQEDLEKWQGYKGLEIFNGTIGRLDGSQFATDRWDRLLSKGFRAWGYANDDSHLANGEVARGWNVVNVATPTVDAIVNALANGRFYASTGVVIRSIEVTGTRLRVKTDNADRIVASTIHQKRFAVVDRADIDIDLADHPVIDKYIRIECMGRGEQFAWTQPFFITK